MKKTFLVKTGLSKALYLALMTGMVQHASAATIFDNEGTIIRENVTMTPTLTMVTPGVIIGTDAATEAGVSEDADGNITIDGTLGVPSGWRNTETTTGNYNGSSYAYDKPYLKDGADTTLTINNVDSSKSGKLSSPLYIREGAAFINNSNIQVAVPSQATTLQVAGANASLKLDNSSIDSMVGNLGFIAVGGPDGSGKLELSNNSTLKSTYSMYAGYRAGSHWSSDGAYYAVINSTADGEGCYQDGHYVQGIDGKSYGAAIININSGSTLSLGTELELAQAEMNIDNGSLEFHWTGVLTLGRQTGSSTTLKVSNGGVIDTGTPYVNEEGQLVSGAVRTGDYKAGTAASGKVNITVDGKGSEIRTSYLQLGYSEEGTTMDVTGGAAVNAVDVTLGSYLISGATSTIEVSIDSASTLTATGNMLMEGDSALTLSGDLNVGDSLTLSGATLTFVIDGLNDLPSLTTGELLMEADAVVELLFASEELIESIDFSNLEKLITFTGSDVVEGADEIALTIKYLDGGEESTYSGERIITLGDISTASVPEPTTATLSLLALVGLCARRRRK